MLEKSFWIMPDEELGHRCPVFKKNIVLKKDLASAFLKITAKGVYAAFIDKKEWAILFLRRVGHLTRQDCRCKPTKSQKC